MSLNKHRDESEVFTIDFAARLGQAETLLSVVALRLHKAAGAEVSAEFGAPAGAVNGAMVSYTLAAAAGPTEQAAGIYIIYCEVTTSDGEILVETPSLTVTDTASIT